MKKDIETYFKELKKEDRKISISSFETFIPRKRNTIQRYLPIGIAASLLLVFTLFFNEKEQDHIENQEVVILLEQDSSSQILLEQETSIYDWEPSSSFLINDFND